MIISLNIKNIVVSKKGDLCEGYVYYSSDYDSFIVLLVSHCDDVDTITCYKEFDNINPNAKKFAIELFNIECSKYLFDTK